MMLLVRRSEERGHANYGWLDTHYTFSFANYSDPAHMGFSALRVINDDRVSPGGGFPTHFHKEMEIISYVLDGKLEHKDSMGKGSIIPAGGIQVMSAGTGISHSEFNPSETDVLHFLQIWIMPDQAGLSPSYQQPEFVPGAIQGKLCLIASDKPNNGAAKIHQQADVYACKLEQGDVVTHCFSTGRKGWLHVARGNASLNGISLREGDGVAVNDENEIRIQTNKKAEIVLFDLP
ncbi:Pirin [hydrothermal vent metagenome]|uniref:Pirin n=1 Tax=hydrothermal vent metagenome TaxID=652676 RepID=A0A3B0ZCB6_9ZZZZ